MKTVMTTALLLSTLQANKDKHRAIFLEAQTKYRAKAIEALEARLKDIREGKPIDTYIHLTVPMDQTKDYERVISMLKSSISDEIELNEEDYTKFVLDTWDWTNQFRTSNSTYVKMDQDE